MARLALAAALAALLCPAVARADAPHADSTADAPPVPLADRPTSGSLSVLSGRTLGVGRTTLVAGAGWPGAFVELHVAPSSTFNVAFRGAFDWASPLMGIAAGLGGDLRVQARLHVFGSGTMDVSLAGRVVGVLGQASLVGRGGASVPDPYGNALGWGAHADAGVLAGFELSEGFTLTLGAMLGGGLVDTPSANIAQAAAIGLATVIAAAEISVAEDVLLFVDVEGGGGFNTGDNLFGSSVILRASAGVAIAP